MTPLPFSMIFVLLVQAREFRPKVHEDTAGSSWVTSVTVKCGKVRTSGVKSGNLAGTLARDVAGGVVKFPESEIHSPIMTTSPLTASPVSELKNKIEQRQARIAIIGLGYVGLPLALLFSEEKFRVTGFDIDAAKVDDLNGGRSYIHRIEPEHIRSAQRAGFRATGSFAEVAAMDAILICVPTPLNPDHTPDMSYVTSTIEAIAPYLRAGQLVVLESTTYPGTTEEIIVETINRRGRNRGVKVLRSSSIDGRNGSADGEIANELGGVMVAFSPEREDPGNVITPR